MAKSSSPSPLAAVTIEASVLVLTLSNPSVRTIWTRLRPLPSGWNICWAAWIPHPMQVLPPRWDITAMRLIADCLMEVGARVWRASVENCTTPTVPPSRKTSRELTMSVAKALSFEKSAAEIELDSSNTSTTSVGVVRETVVPSKSSV